MTSPNLENAPSKLDPKNWKPGRWALLTVALYAANFCALTWPLLAASFGPSDSIYGEWQYWVVVGCLSLFQGAALLFPVSLK